MTMHPRHRSADRRGMLLLLVLTALSFFILLGAFLIVSAVRARTAARAFANATQAAAVDGIQARALLDEALLIALRGSKDPNVRGPTGPITESILGDKYGLGTESGTLTLAYSGSAPLLTATIVSGTAPRSWFGRVLTLSSTSAAPNQQTGLPVSFRIVGANSGTAYLANTPLQPGFPSATLPTGTTTYSAIINGREFAAEAYDAYDADNSWLAQPVVRDGDEYTPVETPSGADSLQVVELKRADTPASGVILIKNKRYTYSDLKREPPPDGGSEPLWTFKNLSPALVENVVPSDDVFVPFVDAQVTGFAQVSFQGSRPVEVDNDNDGIADGVWLNNVLPPRPSPSGTFTYRVSYLVLDLDGRLNINTSGARDASGTSAIRRGMGYGPADLVATAVINPLPGALQSPGGSGTNSLWPARFLAANAVTIVAGTASTEQRRPPPGVAVIGRYGRNGAPGVAGDDISALQQTIATGNHGTYDRSLYALTVAGTNAFADLQGSAEVTMRAPSGTAVMPTMRVTVTGTANDDGADDPYELRLDALAPRLTAAVSGSMSGNDDNPFTAADMERILRASDADAATLPQRLAAALGDIAQYSRMRITTDSWDTPAIIGPAATQVQGFLSGNSVPPLVYDALSWSGSNAASPDVAAGLRFNLNRPIYTGTNTTLETTERQAYCKGLYTLIRALGHANAQQAAQWAANVLDFRDDDSTMTRFVYDTNLADGWNPSTSGTGAGTGTVFGIERPDLLITETAGWWQNGQTAGSGTGQLFITLHRPPWQVEHIRSSGTTKRETLAPELGGDNQLHLSSASSGAIPATAGTNPAWQLRFDTNKVVQFQAVAGGTSQPQTQHVLRSGTVTSGTVTVFGAPTAAAAVEPGGYLCVHPATPQRFTVSGSVTPHQVGEGFAPTSSGTITVSLERLADPARANAVDNPYIVVDTAPVVIIDVPPTPPEPPPGLFTKRRRPGPTDSSGTSRGLAAFWNAGDSLNLNQMASGWESGSSAMEAYQYTGSGTNPVPWLHWPNRPFVSHAELALVPSDSPDRFLQTYAIPTSSLVADATVGPLLLDAVHVPSRFAGTTLTLSGTHAAVQTALQTCGLDLLRAGHMSTWREPGKVNVNTIVSGTPSASDPSDAGVWSTVWSTMMSGAELKRVSGPTTRNLTFNPFQSGTPSFAKSTSQLLSLSGSSAQPMAVEAFTSGTGLNPREKNPFLAYATAIRLANTATIRSHVFAVWITLETTDSGDGSKTYHRLFAIVDRSIPVGFREGENLNVRDTIRLRRFLE